MPSDTGISAYAPAVEEGAGEYSPALSVSGEITPENMEAIGAIHNYLKDAGVYIELDKMLRYLTDNTPVEVSFDSNLGQNTLGQTEVKGVVPYCEISLNPRIYEESYLNLEDGSDEQLIAKYLQAGVLIHEKVHEMTLRSPKIVKAIGVLERLGYGEDNIRGFLEMLAEEYMISSFVEAEQHDVAWMGRRYTPYRRALEAGDNIKNFFVYGENEEYRGLEGFIEALAGGKLDTEKDIVEKYLGGLEVKLVEDAPEPYGHGKYDNPIRKYIEDLFSEENERKEYETYGGLYPDKAAEPIKPVELGVMHPEPVASSPQN